MSRRTIMRYIIPAITSIIVAIIGTWGTIHVAGQTATQALKDSKDAQEQIKTATSLANAGVSGGTISANGAKETRVGRDFEVTSEGLGKKRITFRSAFTHKPVAVAEISMVRNGLARTEIIDEQTLIVSTFDQAWKPMDLNFSFLV